jgi:hypothetical protein
VLTISDIPYIKYIYEHANNWVLLLYQLDLRDIPLRNANLMFFIQAFNNTMHFQTHIDTNPQKMITLFASDRKMEQWLTSIIDIPNNLQEIIVFCHSNDQKCFTDWANRYMQRFRNIIGDIITFEHLNHDLLLFGLEHIEKLRREFVDDYGILNLLDSDYREISRSLRNHASQRVSIENERIRLGQEAQN